MNSMGELVTHLTTDNSQMVAGLGRAQASLASFASYASTTLAGLAASFAGIDLAKNAISAAESDIAATRKLEIALAATGNAAGVTSDEINSLATHLQRMAGVEDDAVVGAAALLTQFKNISGTRFTGTLRLAQDLAALKDVGISDAVVALGKAINDPLEGLNKLARAGVTLTDSQKELITTLAKTGDMAGAQTAMLKALEDSFGGMAEGTVSSTKRIELAIGSLMELAGKEMLPAIELISQVGVPALYGTADAAEALSGKLSEVRGGLAGVAETMSQPAFWLFLPWVQAKGAVELLNESMKETRDVAQNIGNFDIPSLEGLEGSALADGLKEASVAAFDLDKRLQDLRDDIAVLGDGASRSELEIARLLDAGAIDQFSADTLRNLEAQKAALESGAKSFAETQRQAEAIRRGVMTPQEIFDADMRNLQRLADQEFITPEEFDRAKAKAAERLKQATGEKESRTPPAIGAFQKGSQEALSAIFTAQREKDNIGKKQLEELQESNVHLANIKEDLRDSARGSVQLIAGSLS